MGGIFCEGAIKRKLIFKQIMFFEQIELFPQYSEIQDDYKNVKIKTVQFRRL